MPSVLLRKHELVVNALHYICSKHINYPNIKINSFFRLSAHFFFTFRTITFCTLPHFSEINQTTRTLFFRKKQVSKRRKKKRKTPKDEDKIRKVKRAYNNLKCKSCNILFKTHQILLEHKKYHYEPADRKSAYKYDPTSELHICHICSAEFQDKMEADEHIKENHEEKFQCERCNTKFSTAYYFSCHMRTHDPTQMFVCPLCPYSTPRHNGIMSHIDIKHCGKYYNYCKTCGKGFNDSVFLREHEKAHFGLNPFVCVVCSKSFAFSRYLVYHQTRSHTVSIEGQLQKNQCGICLRKFSKSQTLERHVWNKHENKVEKETTNLCDVCGKSFGATDKMLIHRRVHTGVKPYVCRFCGKGFTRRDYLVMHERVHTGEKPYSCEYCGKCFNQAASLRVHVRGHTGEKPYVCQCCNNGFVSKGSLTMHQKSCQGDSL